MKPMQIHLTSIWPSYLSFEYALTAYSLIPEAVYRIYTSSSFKKKKAKKYQNTFGTFTYRDVPSDAYPFGILLHEENGYSYQMATPEKALCNKLYSLPPVRNLSELRVLLFDDLCIDEPAFQSLDINSLKKLVPLCRATNLNLLGKVIRRVNNADSFVTNPRQLQKSKELLGILKNFNLAFLGCLLFW